MPRPPEDDDALFEELMAQVDQAFAALEHEDGPLDSDLAQSVRDAVRSVMADANQPDGPRVVVLEGGRAGGEGTSDDLQPDLHVAEPPDDDDTAAGPRSSVRVVRVGTRPRVSVQESPLYLEGSLRVGAGEEQTVFRGADPRTYRLSCDTGAFDVAVDGRRADRIGPGQSIDVEAGLIRIAAAEASTGRYARVS